MSSVSEITVDSFDGVEDVHVSGGGQLFVGDVFDVSDAVIDNVAFTGVDFSVFEVRDTVFRDCDFSGAMVPPRSRLTRVRFESVRSSGLQLNDVSLRNVAFVEGALDLASFRMCQMVNVEMLRSKANEIDFTGSKITSSDMFDCDLTGADFSHCTIDNVDLRGSTLQLVRGVTHLKGTTISQDQLFALSPQLAQSIGIAIAD